MMANANNAFIVYKVVEKDSLVVKVSPHAETYPQLSKNNNQNLLFLFNRK